MSYEELVKSFVQRKHWKAFEPEFIDTMCSQFGKLDFDVALDLRIAAGHIVLQQDFEPGPGYYFITLTSKERKPFDIIQCMNKILFSKIYMIDKYICTWELTKAGMPHMHMLVHVGKSTPKKRDLMKFNGGNFVDMRRVPGPEVVKVVSYMRKADKDVELLKYLSEFGLPKYYRRDGDETPVVQKGQEVLPQEKNAAKEKDFVPDD